MTEAEGFVTIEKVSNFPKTYNTGSCRLAPDPLFRMTNDQELMAPKQMKDLPEKVGMVLKFEISEVIVGNIDSISHIKDMKDSEEPLDEYDFSSLIPAFSAQGRLINFLQMSRKQCSRLESSI